jgi:hypothetical protein
MCESLKKIYFLFLPKNKEEGISTGFNRKL